MWRERPKHDDANFPLLLAHGRVLAQTSHPLEVVSDGGANHIRRTEELLVHPADMTRLGLADGQAVRAVTERGVRLSGVVRASEDTHPGVVSVTTLFGELASALDASEHPDPMNHVPRLEAAAVRIEPA